MNTHITDHTDLDALLKELMQDNEVRVAAVENSIRREMAVCLEAGRQERGLSYREFAKELGTSVSHVQRLLHAEVGGTLTLSSIVRAALALDMELSLRLRARRARMGNVYHLAVTRARESEWQQMEHQCSDLTQHTPDVGVPECTARVG